MSSDRSEYPSLRTDPGEMRRLGYAVVDAVVDRFEHLRDDVPWQGGERSELEPLFREPCPEEPGDADAVIERAVSEVLSRAGRIDHPRFMAFVPSAPTWPAILGDILATGFNTFQGTWLESAGPSQIELVVLDWFREWLAMPEGAGGLFTSGGSAANLIAVVAAREAALRRVAAFPGDGGPAWRPTVYLSEQSHSSMERACRIVGLPAGGVRRIACDGHFRMRVDALQAALDEDRAAGATPVLVAANAGATNTGAVDPLAELAEFCRGRGVWFHVDAAYGGFAVLTERGRRELRGIGAADSVTLDPHKWLFQPYETGCLMARDPGELEAAFRVIPEYLQDTELGMEHVNFADRGVQLTRSFRALKVWMSLQVLGRAAHARGVAHGIDMGDRAGEWIEARGELELLSRPSLGIVCFRYLPPAARGDGAAPEGEELEALNADIQDRIVTEGSAMMSSTRLGGRYSLRLCIMNPESRWSDVVSVLERIVEVGDALSTDRGG